MALRVEEKSSTPISFLTKLLKRKTKEVTLRKWLKFLNLSTWLNYKFKGESTDVINLATSAWNDYPCFLKSKHGQVNRITILELSAFKQKLIIWKITKLTATQFILSAGFLSLLI